MTWSIVTEYLWICFICRDHNSDLLSSFIAYHQSFSKTDATSDVRNTYLRRNDVCFVITSISRVFLFYLSYLYLFWHTGVKSDFHIK
jgi:hypothetical protein